jgi:glutaredoxin
MNWFRRRKSDEVVGGAINGTVQVSMYTLSVCPSCDKAKKFFSERHIAFQFINYDLADEATQDRILRELEAEDVEAFPFVRIGDQIVQGYDPKRYSKLLATDSELDTKHSAAAS